MKRLLLAAIFIALLAGGYYYSDTLGQFLLGAKPP